MTIPLARVEAVLAHGGRARESHIHGEDHWRKVAIVGRHLAAASPEADEELVVLFALIHDMRRENDDHDPQHGPRAALLARALNADFLGLEPARLDLLAEAIDGHTRMGPSADPTIGVCLDADRLNLWRVGITPDPRFLSTAFARRTETIAWAAGLNRAPAPDWPSILEPAARPDAIGPRRGSGARL